jgi:DNA modification methylase
MSEPTTATTALGRCTLLQGDWADLTGTLAPQSIDLLYADPPFNTGRTQVGSAGQYADSFASTDAFIAWLRLRLVATIPALKPSACILIHLDYRTSHRARVLLDELLGEDRFVNHLIWSYGLGGSSPRTFARKHDDILFYCQNPELYYFQVPRIAATSARMKGQSKKMTDVLDIPSINNMALERTGYPTQKPLALLQLLVDACCPPGGVVLDPCCGSGTTLVAAAESGRTAIGIDRNPEALDVAVRRLEAATAARSTPPA